MKGTCKWTEGRAGGRAGGTGRDGTGRDGTGRDGTGRDGTGRDGTGRDGTGRDGTGRDGTGRDGTRHKDTETETDSCERQVTETAPGDSLSVDGLSRLVPLQQLLLSHHLVMSLPLVQVLAPLALIDVLDPRQVAPVLPATRQTFQMLFLESAVLVFYLFIG